MKTEPTEEMREKIEQLFDFTDGDKAQIDMFQKIKCEIAITAFKKGQSNPKIKQLQWVMTGAKDNPDNIITNTPFNYYRIDNYGDGIWYLNSDKFDEEEFSSLEEAKKAAQRDFEQKVKECLE